MRTEDYFFAADEDELSCETCGKPCDNWGECDSCHDGPLCTACLRPWDDVIGDLCASCYRKAP